MIEADLSQIRLRTGNAQFDLNNAPVRAGMRAVRDILGESRAAHVRAAGDSQDQIGNAGQHDRIIVFFL